ncbi:MAG: isochorismatase family protein, partial [Pirellulales bacterium]|nr:isochorismatase family protein [Pirellulales bacterium]
CHWDFSFFDNGHRRATGLEEYLQSIHATALSVLGLATDYCVKFTVLDALQLGYRTSVLLKGCRGMNLPPGNVDAAIEQMRDAGAEIVL